MYVLLNTGASDTPCLDDPSYACLVPFLALAGRQVGYQMPLQSDAADEDEYGDRGPTCGDSGAAT
jgi:hypothetical protein